MKNVFIFFLIQFSLVFFAVGQNNTKYPAKDHELGFSTGYNAYTTEFDWVYQASPGYSLTYGKYYQIPNFWIQGRIGHTSFKPAKDKFYYWLNYKETEYGTAEFSNQEITSLSLGYYYDAPVANNFYWRIGFENTMYYLDYTMTTTSRDDYMKLDFAKVTLGINASTGFNYTFSEHWKAMVSGKLKSLLLLENETEDPRYVTGEIENEYFYSINLGIAHIW